MLKAHTSLSPQYFLSLHFTFTYARMLSVTAGNPAPSPWTAAMRVQLAELCDGHRVGPYDQSFKNVFSVTEIPATCNPQYFNYALVLANSEKNALCGRAYLGIVASACSPLRFEKC